jgi:hypothetical protein
MPKECAFCPSRATLTGEHLWSDWINGVLPKSSYSFTRKDTPSGKSSTWKGENLNLKARVVCGPCNHGWMSDIESNEAKPSLSPLIRDTSPEILPARVLISIAIFLLKTAVVADHMRTGGTPFFTAAERYTFRETQCIPLGVSMWIGALEDSFRGTFRTAHVVPVAASENDFGLYVFTFVVGHLALQLVGAKWATHNPNRNFLPPIQMESDASFFAQFWPLGGAVKWPPQDFIPVRFLNDLTDRWRTYNVV